MGMCQRHPAILLKKVKCHDTRWASGLGVGGLFRINFLVYSSVLFCSCIKGAMYVQDGSLHYRTACGRNLCCKCCSSRYDLAEIKSVEVVQNQSMGGHNLHIPIGLKITMRDGTLIIVAMKDATEFAPQLMKSCNLLTEDF